MAAVSVFNSAPSPTQINASIVVAPLSTAMTATKSYDGTEAVGTAMRLVYTARSTGGQLPKLKLRFGSTAGAQAVGTTTATVARIWLNNGSVNTTATNNVLIGEVSIAATLMTQTASVSQPSDFDFGLLTVRAGWQVYVGLATAVGGTACAIIPSMVGGGDFA